MPSVTTSPRTCPCPSTTTGSTGSAPAASSSSRWRGPSSRACAATRRSEPLEVLRVWNDAQHRDRPTPPPSARCSPRSTPTRRCATRGETVEQEVQKLDTDLSLDRELYDVFAALDARRPRRRRRRGCSSRRCATSAARGVDQDDATRARLARDAASGRSCVGQEFSKNIRDDVRTVKVTPEQLAGLPQDWLDAHPADDDGLVTLTTDYPDVVPFRTFARDARGPPRRSPIEFLNRRWPANDAAAHGAVRRCAASTPRCSATPTGPTTTPRSR